jgi:hypothetical protein
MFRLSDFAVMRGVLCTLFCHHSAVKIYMAAFTFLEKPSPAKKL